MGFVTIKFNDISFINDNFNEDDYETIVHVRLMAWCNLI